MTAPPGKVELHCHLDGLLSPTLLAELIARGMGDGLDARALSANVPVRGWDHWINAYAPAAAPQERPEARFMAVLELHLAGLRRQGVSYAEIMLAGLLRGEVTEAVERVRAFRAAADRASGDALRTEFLVCVHRGRPERAQELGRKAVALAKAGLVAGVAIAGDEREYSVRDWREFLASARDAGLGVEIHAGEMAGPESVRDALEHGAPERLGHAVRAFEDPELIAELKDRDVHLEFCPSSNVCLGAVPSIDAHPIRTARDLGLNFGINTDDPGPFACTLESEYALLERTFGFTAEDFSRANANAWRSRFGRDR